MKRFAAQQPGVAGKPLYYLIEYEVTLEENSLWYTGRAFVTNDFNKELTLNDEAFSYRFQRAADDWGVINHIKIESPLGEEMAGRIRNSFFNDLILSGTMAFEQKQNQQN